MHPIPGANDLELWGGHECTVNRLSETYFDQTVRTGHQDRLDDLDRFSELGLTALRYPVLWERVAPRQPLDCDWSWSDERLRRLDDLGLRPIVGLSHHGGGPCYTGLLDESFAPQLAAFARATAERYPWVSDWTPVNEPLTTARFSCLYGHWHPHLADERAFWLALLNQIDAVRLAMGEIRQVNPKARLIQTEDLGFTYATPELAHQALFDNHRRWMTWDLLCGRVGPNHPFWARLCDFGFETRLRRLADHPCPPDILGVNHYLTSDRFLDHRCERYPAERCGGNTVTRYADVEAIRVLHPPPGGLSGALEAALQRYQRPVALTEVHNGCTREEQVRWLVDAFATAQQLRSQGRDIRAVTAWSLLGAYDWDSLLTRCAGRYEPGAFDVRGPRPRITAVGRTFQTLAGRAPPAAAVGGAGWWRRDTRLAYETYRTKAAAAERTTSSLAASPPAAPLLITGASGTLGQALARACEARDLAYVLTDRAGLDLASEESITRALEAHRPWAVINAAGFVRVDEAERDPQACFAANAHGPVRLARACAEKGARFIGFSSDLVFDGAKGQAYVESDPVAPLNTYGASKAAAERGVLEASGEALMIRTAAFFSPHDPHNFAADVVRHLAGGHPMAAAADLIVSPTLTSDLADAALDLCLDGEAGLWHLANAGAVSWAEFARALARAAGLDEMLIQDALAGALPFTAPRPPQVPLASERGQLLPALADAIVRWGETIRASAPLAQAPRPTRRRLAGRGRARA